METGSRNCTPTAEIATVPTGMDTISPGGDRFLHMLDHAALVAILFDATDNRKWKLEIENMS